MTAATSFRAKPVALNDPSLTHLDQSHVAMGLSLLGLQVQWAYAPKISNIAGSLGFSPKNKQHLLT